MARLAGGARAVAHEFDDRLLFHRQAGVEFENLIHLALELGGADFRRRGRAKLVAARQREWLDPIPVRREEARRDFAALAIVELDRLPTVRVVDFLRGIQAT